MDKKLKKAFDSTMSKIMQNRERYVEAWVAETGINPKDAVLMQENTGSSIRMWVRPKNESELELDALNADGERRIALTRKQLEVFCKKLTIDCDGGMIRGSLNEQDLKYDLDTLFSEG